MKTRCRCILHCTLHLHWIEHNVHHRVLGTKSRRLFFIIHLYTNPRQEGSIHGIAADVLAGAICALQ